MDQKQRTEFANALRERIREMEDEIARLAAELRAILLAHEGPEN
jgi:hypothetical protein